MFREHIGTAGLLPARRRHCSQVIAREANVARRRVTRLGVAVVAALMGLLSGTGLVPTAHAAGGCAPYEVFSMRGSGNPDELKDPGTATPLTHEFATLELALRADPGLVVRRTIPEYEAAAVTPGFPDWWGFSLGGFVGGLTTASGSVLHRYTESVRRGRDGLLAALNSLPSRCGPETRIVLMGYSQGAHVIGDVLESGRLTRAARDRIVGVTLIGDPRFNPEAPTWPADAQRRPQGSFDPGRHGVLGARPTRNIPPTIPLRTHCVSDDVVCQGVSSNVLAGMAGCGVVGAVGSAACASALLAHQVGRHVDGYRPNEAELAAYWLAKRIRADRAARAQPVASTPAQQPRPLDVAFVIDSTGSMREEIDDVLANVATIRERFAASSTGVRTALVEYRDEPSEDSEFQARTVLGLSEDPAAFSAALGSITADGGGDADESVFSGLVSAAKLAWRPDATRAVILIGDAAPKDPEPVTGFTLAGTTAALNAASLSVHALVVDDAAAKAFAQLAAGTSGATYDVASASEVADRVIAAGAARAAAPTIPAIGAPSASLRARARSSAVSGGFAVPAGEPLALSSASASSPFAEDLDAIWDFGDGTSITTAATVVAHAWSAPGAYTVRLTVRDTVGRSATTIVPVSVTPAAAPPVAASPSPIAFRQRPREGLRVTWRPAGVGAVERYEVLADGLSVGIAPGTMARPGLMLRRDGLLAPTAVTVIGRRASGAPASIARRDIGASVGLVSATGTRVDVRAAGGLRLTATPGRPADGVRVLAGRRRVTASYRRGGRTLRCHATVRLKTRALAVLVVERRGRRRCRLRVVSNALAGRPISVVARRRGEWRQRRYRRADGGRRVRVAGLRRRVRLPRAATGAVAVVAIPRRGGARVVTVAGATPEYGVAP